MRPTHNEKPEEATMKYQALNAEPRHQGPRKRYGSALLLVVVLVLLLSLMGTTFLFMMRAARIQSAGPGSGNLMQGTWPIVPQNDLDTVINTVQGQVEAVITQAVRPSGGPYLQPSNLESQYTHPGTANTLYLGDRFPITDKDLPSGSDEGAILWRYLSENPLHTGDRRTDLYASQLRVTYPTSGNWPKDAGGTDDYPVWAQQALSGRTRIFPAFATTSADAKRTTALSPGWSLPSLSQVVPPNTRFLAGDADGDGVVDCQLYRQGSNGTYDFWVGVRVIDNNGGVNVNTAWRSLADRDFGNTDIPADNSLTAYLGAFRANIGLDAMLIGSTTEGTNVATPAIADTEVLSLDAFRFGATDSSSYGTLRNVYTGDDDATTGAPLGGFEHLTVADALEYGLARRLGDTAADAKLGFYSPASRFTKFEDITHDQLAWHFGLVDPNFGTTQLNARLPFTALGYAPNTRNSTVVPQFLFYGANQSDYWYHTVLSTDSGGSSSRAAFLTKTGNTNYPNALTLSNIVKTIRPHLVGENGVSVSAPFVDPPAAGLVPISTDSATWDAANPSMADYAATDSPRKVWVNGAKFGELWRAYYNVFKATGSTIVQTTNYSKGANANGDGLPGWTDDKQVLLRAAIAANNTLQARLPDTADALAQTVTIGGTNIKVFGAKRQPFISEVMVEVAPVDPSQSYDAVSNPAETKWVAIELHNPYDKAVSLQNQRFFISNGATWVPAASLAGQPDIPAGGFRVIVASKAGYTTAGTPIAPKADLIELAAADAAPLLGIVPSSGGNSNILRLVTSDGTTPNTANGYDMIPQDEVSFNGVDPDSSTVRYRYARYTGGNGFLCVFNEMANGFGKSTYDQVKTTWPDDGIAAGTLVAPNPTAGNAAAKKLTIQVGNYSTYKPGTVVGQAFPFGGFARDGDILHVAYIGAYSYTATPSAPNGPYTCSVGRDAFYAEDQVTGDELYEAVGRFAPLSALNMATGTPGTYDWAARLFDFVTATQHPGSEYTPDIAGIAGTEKLAYTGRSIQGKLNINTASWQALAALPLVPGSASDTVKLAKAIVYFRDVNNGTGHPNGAFTSIFDLNLVTKNAAIPALNGDFADFAGKTAGVANNAALTATDLTTSGAGGVGDLSSPDGAIGDFEQRLLGVTRLSNLLTTRSDSFTVYIVVQAWKHNAAPDNVGVPPIMVAEKRRAVVMDRTTLTRVTSTNISTRELKDRP